MPPIPFFFSPADEEKQRDGTTVFKKLEVAASNCPLMHVVRVEEKKHLSKVFSCR